MRNLGAAIAGGNGSRRADDFYPTPWEATEALCLWLKRHGWFPEYIWEPACGDGAMARVLEAHGASVHASDLIDRGFGQGGVDFLKFSVFPSPAVITNPPFNLAADFIVHSRPAKLRAFLLKAQFWNVAKRLPLFHEDPPAWVLPLTWRVDFTGQKAPTMDLTWCVWGVPTRGFEPLPRPTLAAMLA